MRTAASANLTARSSTPLPSSTSVEVKDQNGPVEKDRLSRLEHDVERLTDPAWRRRSEGEHRLPSALCVAALIGLQLSLPERLSLGSRWALPGVEAVLILLLLA